MIGDPKGISDAFLPDRIELREGDSIVLFGAKAEVVKEHIEVQLVERGDWRLPGRGWRRLVRSFFLSSRAWFCIE